MKKSAKRILSLCLCAAMLFCLWPMTAMADSGPFAGGSGTAADPWLIANETQLAKINGTTSSGSDNYRVGNHYFKLINDIKLTGVFNQNTRPKVFDGTFDGNGYTISGLSFSFISTLESKGQPNGNAPITVKNLNLELAENWTAGAGALFNTMAGDTGSGTSHLVFSNVHVTVNTKSGDLSVGLTGEPGGSPVTIKGCSVTVEPGARLEARGTGNLTLVAGGLIKHIRPNTVLENSFVHIKEGGRIGVVTTNGDVSGWAMAGGLAGTFQSSANTTSQVKNCYVINEGEISTSIPTEKGMENQGAGGLVGYSYAKSGAPSVTNSYVYNSGEIKSVDSTGILGSKAGIVYGKWMKDTWAPVITGVYYNADANCAEASGGSHSKVTPLSMEAMKTAGSYVGWNVNEAGSPWKQKAEQAPAKASGLEGLPYLIVEDNAKITPATGSFNKSDAAPVVTTVSGGGELQSISNGENPLRSGEDYTFENGVLTIKSSYLETLDAGAAVTLTLAFTEGENIDFVIAVTEEEPSDYTVALVNSDGRAGAPYAAGRVGTTFIVPATEAAGTAFTFYAEPKEGYVLEKWVDGDQKQLAVTDPYVMESVTGSLQVIPVYKQVANYVDILVEDALRDVPLEGPTLTLSKEGSDDLTFQVPKSGHIRRELPAGTYSYMLTLENYAPKTGAITVNGSGQEKFSLSMEPYYRGPYNSAEQTLSVTAVEGNVVTVEYGISNIRAVSGELKLGYDTAALTLLADGSEAEEGATPGAVAVPGGNVVLVSGGAVNVSEGALSLTWHAKDSLIPRYVDALTEKQSLLTLRFQINEGAALAPESATAVGKVAANDPAGKEINGKNLSLTLQKVETPVIVPSGSVFEGTQQVSLTCETPDAAIYYTVNGEEPSAVNGTEYQEPFTISGTVVVKAMAVKTGMSDSDVAQATFTEEGDTKADITGLTLTIGEETYVGRLTGQTTTGGAFTVILPYGTDEEQLGSLTPEITVSTGASITPEGPQDFSSPVTYTVTSANGETEKTYTVTVVIASLEDHMISAALTSHGAVTIDPLTATSGTSIKVEANPDPGYELESLTWSVAGGPETDITEGTFEMPDGDVTITAVFRAVTYNITYELDGGSKDDQSSYTVEELPLTLTAPAKDGFTFTGWTYDDVSEPVLTVTLEVGATGDKTFTANWSENTGVTVSGQVSSYNPGNATTITLYAVADTDHETALYTAEIAATEGSGQLTQDFAFEGVAAGTYDLVVTKDGHLDYTITGVVVEEEELDLTFNDNEAISIITLLAGDVNKDGKINSSDLRVFNQNFGKTGPGVTNQLTDLNGDGKINNSDLRVFSTNFGKIASNNCMFKF